MPADTRFSTPARSLEELRQEVLTDIHRRLARLDTEAKFEKRATACAAIGRAQRELTELLDYWSRVQLRDRAKRRPTRHPTKDLVHV